MTEIYCVVCGKFTQGKETENGEGICAKCEEQVEQIAEGE